MQPLYSYKKSSQMFVVAMALIMGVQLLFAFVLVGIQGDDINISMTLNIVAMLLLQGALLTAFVVTKREPLPRTAVRSRFVCNYRIILISLVMWAVAFVGFLSTNVYFSMLLDYGGYTSAGLAFGNTVDILLGAIAIGLVAPIVEELLFRHGMLEGYRSLGAFRAVLWTSLAFSLMHMNPEQTFYQFFLGATCAWAAIKSKSVIPAIIIHMVNNIVAFALMWMPAFDNTLSQWFVQPWFVLVAIALFVGGILGIYHLGKLCGRVVNDNATVTEPQSIGMEVESNHPFVANAKQAIVGNDDYSNQRPLFDIHTGLPLHTQQTSYNIDEYTKRQDKMTGRLWYWIAVGICSVVWVFVLVDGLVGGL